MSLRTTIICFIASAALLLNVPAAHAQSAPADSMRAAEYTAPQATKGESTFRSTCGNCHAITQFHGPAFRKVWTGRRVYDLFDQVRNTMPLDNPGGLERDDYAAVVAYILKLNAYEPGLTPLPSSDEQLKHIRF